MKSHSRAARNKAAAEVVSICQPFNQDRKALQSAADQPSEVQTEFAELAPDRRIEAIEHPDDPDRMVFAYYRGGKVELVEKVEWGGKLYLPKHSGNFARVRLSRGAAAYKSVRELLNRISGVLHQCIDLDPSAAALISAFVLCTWLPEKLPIAPYLALVGTPRSGKTTLLRLLELVCRHSVLISDTTPWSLSRLYQETVIPTILIDETSTAADQKKLFHLLRIGSTPGSIALRRDRSVNCFGPKVLAWTQLPADRALLTRCLIINMRETERRDLIRVSDPSVVSSAENLQKSLLYFRLARFGNPVSVPCRNELHARNRDLYEALSYAIADDKKLCDLIAYLLSEQERFTREPLSENQTAVLTVLMIGIHTKFPGLRVGHLANFVNDSLELRNHQKLTPHAIGDLLSSLGMDQRKRTNKGWIIEFDDAFRRYVHVMTKRYAVSCDVAENLVGPLAAPIFGSCQVCEELGMVQVPKVRS